MDDDSLDTETKPVNKLPFVANRNMDEGKLKYQQDREFAQATQQDQGTDLGLPLKKSSLREIKTVVQDQQQNLKGYKEELASLEEKLRNDEDHQQAFKRKEYVKTKIEELSQNIVELGRQQQTLKEEIGTNQETIQKFLANMLFKELLENRAQVKSIDETGELYTFKSPGKQVQVSRLIGNLPSDVLALILLKTVEWRYLTPVARTLFPIFPDLWNARLVSKPFKEAADKAINTTNNQRPCLVGRLRPTDIDDKEPVLSAIRLFSLQELYLVGNWMPSSLERLSEIFSAQEFSQITSLFYNQSGLSGALGVEGAFRLSRNFKGLHNLETLSIEGDLDEEGGKYISSSLYHLPKLKSLRIYASGMGPLAVKKLAKNLKYLPLLEDLNLWGSNPGEIGAAAIAKSLKEYVPDLKSLNLATAIAAGPYDQSKIIYEAGFKTLAKALAMHPSITFVSIGRHDAQGSTVLDNLKNKNQNRISILR